MDDSYRIVILLIIVFIWNHLSDFNKLLFPKYECWKPGLSSPAQAIRRVYIVCEDLLPLFFYQYFSYWSSYIFLNVVVYNSLLVFLNCRYVESNPQYAESSVYLVKFRQLQVSMAFKIILPLWFQYFVNGTLNEYFHRM